MAQPPMSSGLVLSLLDQTPTKLSELTQDFDEAELTRRAKPEEWSIIEVLAHLRASADIRGEQRILNMLHYDEPRLVTDSPRNWSLAVEYAGVPFCESLVAFSEQRKCLLDRLRALPSENWQRGATLTGVRPVRRETVHSEADALIRHELRHLQQIKRTVGLVQIRVPSGEQRQRKGLGSRRRGNIRW